jgi:hypothetical protein
MYLYVHTTWNASANNLYVPHFIVFETERRCRVVNTSVSYTGGAGFKFLLGDWLPKLRCFVVFLNPSRAMPGYYLQTEHNHFLSNSFQLIIHLSPYYSTVVTEETS